MPQNALRGTAGEARVVGGERDPGDRDGDDDVCPLPHGQASLAWSVPRGLETAGAERPPGEVGERQRHSPHADRAYHAPHHADRPEQAEGECEAAEDERPEPLGAEAEELVGERSGRVAMTSSSNTVQPMHCMRLTVVGT